MSDHLPEPERFLLHLAPRVTMAFRLIPAGEFIIGSREGDPDEQPPHRVVISRPFWMGETPVTQEQFAVWTRSAGIKHENHFKDKPTHPAEHMLWHEAVAFCRWLMLESGAVLPAGFGHACLPTEAEWEYACRAGTTTDYHMGDGSAALDEAGWFYGNANSTTHPVGQKAANGFNLHDMHGNVWEWCGDIYEAEAYTRRMDGVVDPSFPCTEREDVRRCVVRGGSWNASVWDCRVAFRNRGRPGSRGGNLGLRVCLVSGPPSGPGKMER